MLFLCRGLAALLILQTFSAHAAEESGGKRPAAPAVLVQPAELRSLERQYEFVGRVEALEKVELRARVKGFLGERLFKDGDPVEAGQTVFRIERAPFEATVAQRKAAVASADATLAYAKQQLDRANELFRANSTAISQTTIDQRVAEEQRARAALLEADAALKQAEIELSYTEIKSPITGRIGRPAVSPGNLVSPESGVLATIVAEDPVEVLFPVSQRELLEYRKGGGGERDTLTARVRLADGSVYEQQGRIDFLDVTVDPRTDGRIVRATMPNPDGFLTDGQTVRVIIEQQKGDKVVTIPRAAIVIDQAGSYVFVVNDQNVVEQRRLKLGAEKGSLVAVTEGLAAGDSVVVQGHQRIKPGIVVAAQIAASPQGAAAP